jgi:hypothetical protein
VARIGAWLFVPLCAAWYLRASFFDQLPSSSLSDFSWYHLAAQHVAHGRSPFLSAGYLYPPLLAFLLLPLAPLDYVTARWVWFLFSHACLLAAAWWMWRRLGADRTAACVVALVWAFGGAAGESLSLGQVGPLLTLLLALTLTQTGWRQGTALGAGVALKLIPGVLGLLLLLRRDWRALAAAALVTVILLAISWGLTACCLAGALSPASQQYLGGTPALLSWSLPSVFLRLADAPRSGGPLPTLWLTGNTLQSLHLPAASLLLSAGVSLATLGMGLLSLAFVLRGKLPDAEFPLAGAAMVALGLAALPVAWTHYQVMQYPGVAVILCYAARRRSWPLFAAAMACAALLYPVPVAVLRAAYRPANAWPNSPAFLYFWTSVSPMASLSLFTLILWRLRQNRLRPFIAMIASERTHPCRAKRF